jgi:hypothetical protein
MSNELPQLPLSEKEYADLTPKQIEAIIARELQKPADMSGAWYSRYQS